MKKYEIMRHLEAEKRFGVRVEARRIGVLSILEQQTNDPQTLATGSRRSPTPASQK